MTKMRHQSNKLRLPALSIVLYDIWFIEIILKTAFQRICDCGWVDFAMK